MPICSLIQTSCENANQPDLEDFIKVCYRFVRNVTFLIRSCILQAQLKETKMLFNYEASYINYLEISFTIFHYHSYKIDFGGTDCKTAIQLETRGTPKWWENAALTMQGPLDPSIFGENTEFQICQMLSYTQQLRQDFGSGSTLRGSAS